MLAIDVTHMVSDADEMSQLSGSPAELGWDARRITWRNSQDYAMDHPLLSTSNQIEEAKDYFKGFGAWSREEIAEWTDAEVQAMVVQYIAGQIREMEQFDNYDEYQEAAEQGRVSGDVFRAGDGHWYALLSS